MSHLDGLLRHFPDLLSRRVLDVGCGRGAFVADVAARGGRVVGLEPNPAYAEETKARLVAAGSVAEIAVGPGERMPFPDGSFGFANLCEVIEHVEDPRALLSEVARILEAGGEAYVSAPNRFGLRDQHFHLYLVNWMPRAWAERVIGFLGRHKDYAGPAGRQRLSDMHYYTRRGLARLARGVGLEAEDLRERRVSSAVPRPLRPLAIFLYRVAAFAFLDSFHFRLRRPRGGAPRILVVTTRYPFGLQGACQQDRAEGVRQLVDMGYEVRVLAKTFGEDAARREDDERRFGAGIVALPYLAAKQSSPLSRIARAVRRAVWPPYWDGAAFEYVADADFRGALEAELDGWRPNIVWFDYTFLWPLYPLARRRGVPIVTRSHNFEPRHFLEESGGAPRAYFAYPWKLLSEVRSVRGSDLVFSITPREQKTYASFSGEVKVVNLPLRGLANVEARVGGPADGVPEIVFLGSTYGVPHNRRALEFVLREVVPALERRLPTAAWALVVTGARVPADLSALASSRVRFTGWISGEEFNGLLGGAAAAVVPSLAGAGMQQKVFEPICRGVATVTSARALAGYPFSCGEDLLCADGAEEFAAALELLLANPERREDVAARGAEKARTLLIAGGAATATVQRELEALLARPA